MDYLGAVNRILINNFILKGDDDLVNTFNDNQHEATIRVAQNAITTELNNFVSAFHVDYEKTTGTLTTVVGQRTYSLPTDFVRFFGDSPYLYLPDETYRVYEYQGGENRLRQQDYTYLTTEGRESYWYWDSTITKKIALYNVPDAVYTYSFEYERDVSVSNSTDILPFHTESEAQAFADMASRRFKFMVEELNVSTLEQDADYTFNRSTLMNLMRYREPNKRYGKRYL